MARKGPAPEPTAIKILKGNPSKTKLRLDEPKPPPVESAIPPSFLSGEAKKEWMRVAPVFERIGILTELDTSGLAAYCQAYATWVDTLRKVRKEGMLIEGSNGVPKLNPLLKASETALKQMLDWSREFGLTPSARTRVGAGNIKVPENVDEFEELERRYA